MKSDDFQQIISKFSNQLIFDKYVEMEKKSSFIMVTLINNDQTFLKINFTRCYFSMFENVFNFIWLLFERIHLVKRQYLPIPNMHVKN